MSHLERMTRNAEINRKPVTVSVGLLKMALEEIKMQRVTGDTFLTKAAIATLEDALEKAGHS
ncbi:hypothetical protein [Rosenbergiella nectarea]|uniref:hypothetical protein n=1 Tax=Rosenbergiella nectarea TaxID=988801 RepID=UPI001F4DFE8F|nr:hypothetical protein [Rosenbergiella nectarea]